MGDFFVILNLKSLISSFFSFYYLIKWFFHKSLGFILFFVLSVFGLSPSYYEVWFVVSLLRRRLIATLYLYGNNLDKQNRFDQLKISNYGR